MISNSFVTAYGTRTQNIANVSVFVRSKSGLEYGSQQEQVVVSDQDSVGPTLDHSIPESPDVTTAPLKLLSHKQILILTLQGHE